MKVTLKRKFIAVLVVILSMASLLRLLKIAIITSSSPLSSVLLAKHSKSFPILTFKEHKFLDGIISSRAPCNLLIFGNEKQYFKMGIRNKGGLTIFLDDNVRYNTFAKDAYKLLKHGRSKKACFPQNYGFDLRKSRCKLALTNLPTRVYEVTWDVIVVDGPCGHLPDCPGRMATIYTAGVLARKGNVDNATHVIVHDADRMIEKWFSWEFLCEDNFISSKGKFWNFGVVGRPNSTMFCAA
ncbi:hypothetical protein Leryth_021272 [Lithospermum erythrorhizon]|nr:hypothetical protein Leryth_021272 [Lithospermum erythrorhizon]